VEAEAKEGTTLGGVKKVKKGGEGMGKEGMRHDFFALSPWKPRARTWGSGNK